MDSTDSYPALEDDLGIAKEIIYPAFQRADVAALRFQKRFWRSELILIFGAVAAVALGAVAASAALPGDAALNAWALAAGCRLRVTAPYARAAGPEAETIRFRVSQRNRIPLRN